MPDHINLTRTYRVAQWSRDRSTQNGVIIVNEEGDEEVTGYNDLPPSLEARNERFERPLKYEFTEHAERAAIYRAAKFGMSLQGATMYAAWAACADCARAIVLSGITTLVRHNPDHMPDHDHWAETIAVGDTIMTESGVTIINITDPLPNALPVLRNGRMFQP